MCKRIRGRTHFNPPCVTRTQGNLGLFVFVGLKGMSPFADQLKNYPFWGTCRVDSNFPLFWPKIHWTDRGQITKTANDDCPS